jgi:predicted Fe-S protein YdhL (DUF1289 family)|tara:strand:- start:2754 stop:2966 length:213 start_codon:yes stop_codon:yes gene_type:complete
MEKTMARQIDTTVKSPCIGTCLYDPADGLCLGCKRNPDEIREWMIMTNEEKRAVKEKIHERKFAPFLRAD